MPAIQAIELMYLCGGFVLDFVHLPMSADFD